jgi:restriction system protein
MAVPDFQSLMLPVLQRLADGREGSIRDAVEPIARDFDLSEADILERLPSGGQTRFHNRLAWAHGYLKEAGLLERPRRGVYRITERGRQLLAAFGRVAGLKALSRHLRRKRVPKQRRPNSRRMSRSGRATPGFERVWRRSCWIA